jgi:hypothetical protein
LPVSESRSRWRIRTWPPAAVFSSTSRFAGERRFAELVAQPGVADEAADLARQLLRRVGEQAGLAVDDRLRQAPDRHRCARRAARRGLHHGQAPALGRRGGQVHPRPGVDRRLLVLVDVAVQDDALGQAAVLDLLD